MREIGIGILGFGTVGAGVVDALYKNGEIIEGRSGIKPTIKKIADLDIITDRGITISDDILTTDALSVIEDDDVEVIVELIGGSKIAKELIEHALCLGKPVVTANKALLAEFGHELYNLAEKHDTGIYYEAAVGGGIPVLRAQREGLICNQIESIYGILNGTCNYILSKMENDNLSFEKVLSDAQKLGYAETPPDLDIDGIDTAHKAVLLASMAYGSSIPMSACPTSGIRNISEVDILNSDELGYRIKLLSIIKKIDGLIEISVEATLVPKFSIIGSVNDSFNAVFIKGDIVDDTMYYGRGAGRLPTGSAVISDIMEASKDVINNNGTPMCTNMMRQNNDIQYLSKDNVMKRCYIRLSLKDEPGSMAQVMKVLGEYSINVDSVIQKKQHLNGTVPVIILTEEAQEINFCNALDVITNLSISIDDPVRMRLEDFS